MKEPWIFRAFEDPVLGVIAFLIIAFLVVVAYIGQSF
jgi:hypothetical protein